MSSDTLGLLDMLASVWRASLSSGRVVQALVIRDFAYAGFGGTPIDPCLRVTVHCTAPMGGNSYFELMLPAKDKWNGKFIGHGNGGAGCSVRPFGADMIKRGYATAASDLGTSPSPASGNGNEDVWKDYGYRATHNMTSISKEIIRIVYGREPDRSYFTGGSTGGQQGLQEAFLYPDEYDGIVAMVPAHSRTRLHTMFIWNYQHWFRKDKSRIFTDEQYDVFNKAALDVCGEDEPEWARGRFVCDATYSEAKAIRIADLAQHRCPALTQEQRAAYLAICAGPSDPVTGEKIYGGTPFGRVPHIDNLYIFNWVFGADYNYSDFDFHTDYLYFRETLSKYVDAEEPNFDAFVAHGGKLIMVSGTADEIVPFHGTVELLEKWSSQPSGKEQMSQSMRYFILPGKSHGGDGPGVKGWDDCLHLLMKWCETGHAPDSLHCWFLERDGVHRHELQIPAQK